MSCPFPNRGKGFARDHGVNYQTFASWVQKRWRARGLYPDIKRASPEPMKLALTEVAGKRQADPQKKSPRVTALRRLSN